MTFKVSDVSIARKGVKEEGFAVSIVRDGKRIFQSKTPGISALVTAIDKDRFYFKGASAAGSDPRSGSSYAVCLLGNSLRLCSNR